MCLPSSGHILRQSLWGKGTAKTEEKWKKPSMLWNYVNINILYLSWRVVCRGRCQRRASCGTCCAARGSRTRGCPQAAPHQQGREPVLCSPCIAQNMLCVLQWWQQKKKQSPPLDEKMKWQWTQVTWTIIWTTRTSQLFVVSTYIFF